MFTKYAVAFTTLIAILAITPVISHADETFSVTLSGGQSFSLVLPQQDERKRDISDEFDERIIVGTVAWEAYKYLSVYGKALHYGGESTPGSVWNRDEQQWDKLNGPVSISGTWFGAGVMANTNRDRMISAGLGLGFGYLDNPDDILNSTHGQFNITADITANLPGRWSVALGWEHISNGRQVFKRGGKDSEFYPNNGRNFWTVGATYRF
jgi:hypothetical protein